MPRPLGQRQLTALAVKQGPFVEQPGPFDSFIRIHHRAYLRSETPPLDGGCRTTAEKPKLPGHPESAPRNPPPDPPPRARHESQKPRFTLVPPKPYECLGAAPPQAHIRFPR